MPPFSMPSPLKDVHQFVSVERFVSDLFQQNKSGTQKMEQKVFGGGLQCWKDAGMMRRWPPKPAEFRRFG
jgi:hypothetical protein